MLVLGGGLRGGKVYGRWPGLAREQLFEGRDLAVIIDFRALFSEVATRHLGPPPEPVVPRRLVHVAGGVVGQEEARTPS